MHHDGGSCVQQAAFFPKRRKEDLNATASLLSFMLASTAILLRLDEIEPRLAVSGQHDADVELIIRSYNKTNVDLADSSSFMTCCLPSVATSAFSRVIEHRARTFFAG